MNQYRNRFKLIPFFTKNLLIITFLFSILQLFFLQNILNIFANYPQLTLKFQIWRIFTAPFIPIGLLNGIFTLLMIYWQILPSVHICNKQNSFSTIYMIVDFLIQNTIIQLIYTPLQYFFPLFSNFSCGLWPFFIIYIIRRSLINAETKSQFCFLPCLIKNKYIPLIFLIFAVIGMRLDQIIVFPITYIQSLYFKQSFIKVSNQCLKRMEKFLIQNLKLNIVFIGNQYIGQVNRIQVESIFFGSQPSYSNQNIQNRFQYNPERNVQQQQQTNFFQGQGIRIGDIQAQQNRSNAKGYINMSNQKS